MTLRVLQHLFTTGRSAEVIESPDDAELVRPGDRAALTERPGPTNTGPRQSTTQTMSAAAAIAAGQAAPVEADGYRYVRRARINGSMAFTNAATQSGQIGRAHV